MSGDSPPYKSQLKVVFSVFPLFPACRWGVRRQPQPERPDRAGSRDVIRPHPCTLHPHKQRHCANGRQLPSQQNALVLQTVADTHHVKGLMMTTIKGCCFHWILTLWLMICSWKNTNKEILVIALGSTVKISICFLLVSLGFFGGIWVFYYLKTCAVPSSCDILVPQSPGLWRICSDTLIHTFSIQAIQHTIFADKLLSSLSRNMYTILKLRFLVEY